MEWLKIIVPAVATLIGAAVVVFGWHKSHQLTSERDQRNKRRDLRLTMMLDAYRALANSAHRPLVGDAALEVERALESIQLLGTPKQIDLAQRLVRDFAEHQGVDWQPLLVELRTSLREISLLKQRPGACCTFERETILKRLLAPFRRRGPIAASVANQQAFEPAAGIARPWVGESRGAAHRPGECPWWPKRCVLCNRG